MGTGSDAQIDKLQRRYPISPFTTHVDILGVGMPEAAVDTSRMFIELGCAIVGLALLARVANRWGFSAIPLYLLAGLAFGNGGLMPLNFSKDFAHSGAEIGVLLLLFMLGLEYTGEELKQNLRRNPHR